MRILYIGNMNDIHTPKWIDYFDDQPGVECLRFHVERFSIGKLFELKLLIKSWEPDIVHAHYAGLPGLYGLLSGFRPLVSTIHGSEVLLTKYWRKLMVKTILNHSYCITTDSSIIHKKIVDDWQISHNIVREIKFGVDTDLFKPSEIKTVNPSIIYLRGLGNIYDFKTLLDAFKIIKKKIPDLELDVYGDCSKKGDLRGDFTYIPGVYYQGLADTKTIAKVLPSAWVYVSTALSDAGIASSTAEAMACGLPCLVTDVAENYKWIPSQERFKAGDYKSLAARLQALLTFKPMRKIIGDRNRETIVKNNNYALEMHKMKELYKQIKEEWKK